MPNVQNDVKTERLTGYEASDMVSVGTIRTLAELEEEMGRAGRANEQQALRETLHALARPEHDLLTTGQAAERLGVSIPTIKRWVERGALAGGSLGTRWLISAESVDRLVRLRAAVVKLDREGNPTHEALQALYVRSTKRSASNEQGQAADGKSLL
jgi:excisionase family DNA binding protein